MPRANKPTGALGRAVIRSRFKGQKAIGIDEGKLVRIVTLFFQWSLFAWLLIIIEQHTTDTNEGPNWVKLQSVTQEGDLDAFLHTAELAGTEFTAGKYSQYLIILICDRDLTTVRSRTIEY
jgi:large subunit GTPase 1